ncbi:hypothetical protein D3C87_1773210 [compost metagenome]
MLRPGDISILLQRSQQQADIRLGHPDPSSEHRRENGAALLRDLHQHTDSCAIQPLCLPVLLRNRDKTCCRLHQSKKGLVSQRNVQNKLLQTVYIRFSFGHIVFLQWIHCIVQLQLVNPLTI